MAAGAVFTAVGIDVMLLVRAADDLARQFRE
jgi:2-keto-3-deoxy-L-rhamnonate aldolase RhmA